MDLMSIIGIRVSSDRTLAIYHKMSSYLLEPLHKTSRASEKRNMQM